LDVQTPFGGPPETGLRNTDVINLPLMGNSCCHVLKLNL